jgi:hypothetical protein
LAGAECAVEGALAVIEGDGELLLGWGEVGTEEVAQIGDVAGSEDEDVFVAEGLVVGDGSEYVGHLEAAAEDEDMVVEEVAGVAEGVVATAEEDEGDSDGEEQGGDGGRAGKGDEASKGRV